MKAPKVGDIWLVHYPYVTPGNMEKIRPAIIKKITSTGLIVQKLTTRSHPGNRPFFHPKLQRHTYLSYEQTFISDYGLVRYIGNINQLKK